MRTAIYWLNWCLVGAQHAAPLQANKSKSWASCVGAVAFFVFFSGATRTRIVTPNFRADFDGLRRFRLRRARLILQILLLALLAALDLARDGGQMLLLAGARGGASDGGLRALLRRTRRRWPRLGSLRRRLALLHLNMKQIANGFVVDARHHVFKKDERFLLEFNDGIFLRVAAQAYALFQMIEREKMVLPLRIDNIENNAALQPAHEIRAKLFFFLIVALGDGFGSGVGELLVTQRAGIGAGGFGIDAKLRVDLGEKLRGVPLIGMLLARAKGLHQFARDVFGDPENVIALVLPFQRGAANGINRLALLVHHVVVFKKMFAGVEVLRFDAFLRVFDAIRNHFRFDGHAFGHAEAVHERLDALAAEDAHKVVFKGKKKSRGARVALASGTAAELIIDTARFVALRAENVQTAQRDNFVMLGFALPGEIFIDGLPLVGRDLKDLSFVLEEHHLHGGLRSFCCSTINANHRGRSRIGHGQFIFQAIVAGHLLGIAAEENVRAAAGHVGGHGDGAFASSLRDDTRFALVLLGVEYLMRNASLPQDFGDGFGLFNGDRSDQYRLAALAIVADAVSER